MSKPSVLTDELRALLAPYDDLFDDMTHEQIAEQLELEVEIVAAYHASLQAPEPEEGAAETEPDAPEVQVDTVAALEDHAAEVEPVTQKRLDKANDFGAAIQAAMVAYVETGRGPHGRPISLALHQIVDNHWGAPAPRDVQIRMAETMGEGLDHVQGRATGARAPKSVRVTKKGRVRGPDGRSMTLGFRDIHSGTNAAFLWEHCRDQVEPYPAR